MKCVALFVYLVLFSIGVSSEEVNTSVLNSDGAARASCSNIGIPVCQVVVGEVEVDVSQVTFVNLGKLGIAKKEDYEKIVTKPVKWLKSTVELQIIEFQTQAWRNGQRYTVSEPVLINNGKYNVR